MFGLTNLTSAQVGSAVRWAITAASTYFVTLGIGDGPTWANIALGGAAFASLMWSFWSNVKKV